MVTHLLAATSFWHTSHCITLKLQATQHIRLGHELWGLLGTRVSVMHFQAQVLYLLLSSIGIGLEGLREGALLPT